MTSPTSFSKRAALFICIIVFASFGTLSAQNDTLRHTVSATTAFSIVPLIVGLNTISSIGHSNDIPYLTSFTSSPAIQLTYDYTLNKRISIGAAASCQQFKATYEMLVTSSDNYLETANRTYSETVYRNNISARILFHSYNSTSIDLYSGLRAGCTFWLAGDRSDSTFIGEYEPAARFAPQLILLGARGYITPHFGLGTELCIGSPYYIAAGLNYRF